MPEQQAHERCAQGGAWVYGCVFNLYCLPGFVLVVTWVVSDTPHLALASGAAPKGTPRVFLLSVIPECQGNPAPFLFPAFPELARC